MTDARDFATEKAHQERIATLEADLAAANERAEEAERERDMQFEMHRDAGQEVDTLRRQIEAAEQRERELREELAVGARALNEAAAGLHRCNAEIAFLRQRLEALEEALWEIIGDSGSALVVG